MRNINTHEIYHLGVKLDPSAVSTPERKCPGRESPSPSTARSSRRDSFADKPTGIAAKIPDPTPPSRPFPGVDNLEQSYNGELFKEYQKQKQRLQETIQQKERERDELVRQLSAPPSNSQVIDNRLQGERYTFYHFIHQYYMTFFRIGKFNFDRMQVKFGETNGSCDHFLGTSMTKMLSVWVKTNIL